MAVVIFTQHGVGVNVTLKLLQMAAKAMSAATTLKSSRPTTATRSMPHRAALKMGEVIAETLGHDLKDCPCTPGRRDGQARPPPASGFAAIRAATSWATTPFCLQARAGVSRLTQVF